MNVRVAIIIISISFFSIALTIAKYEKSQPKLVSFFDRAHLVQSAPSLRLYVDNHGNLYPKDGLHEKLVSGEYEHTGSLDYMAKPEGTFCIGVLSQPATEAAQLCDGDWEKVQSIMWKDRANLLLKQTIATDNPIIVVLIHGFRVSDATSDYQLMREAILERLPRSHNPIVVEVNWDGRQPGNLDIGFKEAQFSGPLVGFELRQFFNSLIDSAQSSGIEIPPIRIMTHSSGAFVIGATLGNPQSVLCNLRKTENRSRYYDRFYKERYADAGTHRVPQFADIRLALIAPATPSNTFIARKDWHEVGRSQGMLSENVTIISTLNSKDRVLTKADAPQEVGDLAGATGLGALRNEACQLMQESPKTATMIPLDFTPKKFVWRFDLNSHSVGKYLSHESATELLEQFLDPLPPEPTKMDCSSYKKPKPEVPSECKA